MCTCLSVILLLFFHTDNKGVCVAMSFFVWFCDYAPMSRKRIRFCNRNCLTWTPYAQLKKGISGGSDHYIQIWRLFMCLAFLFVHVNGAYNLNEAPLISKSVMMMYLSSIQRSLCEYNHVKFSSEKELSLFK